MKNITPTRPPYKIETCALEFIKRGSTGMIQLEANQAYGETCLHSEISSLVHKHNITFSRVTESVTNRVGLVSSFTRYALLTESIDRAKRLVNHCRKRRGLPPITQW